MGNLTPLEFQERTGVSRETLEKFQVYESVLRKWQSAINLVGPSTIGNIWERHFLDSAQIYPLISNKDGVLVDLGSGAGFPGLVLAVMGLGNVHLIESDQRKATFLREAARIMNVPVFVHGKRVSDVFIDRKVDFVTARALAPLNELIGMSFQWLYGGATGFFLKGKNSLDEVKSAQGEYSLDIKSIPSLTDPEGILLRLKISN